MNGYRHPLYAQSLSEFGIPRQLPHSQGWILERPVPGFPARDGMGCYPLFACEDWTKLNLDLDELESTRLVSLVLVADPFGEVDEPCLRRCFRDLFLPFKVHLVIDLHRSTRDLGSKHHRYYARKALKQVIVEPCPDPVLFLDEWIKLYATLIERHKLGGVKAFSSTAFARQLRVPGLVLFRAVFGEHVVGAHLWYVQGDVAYSHLAAFSPMGYELMASYALLWTAVEYFADRLRWLDLGAAAGIGPDETGGLSQFKRGWSTGSRNAYLCGRILDRKRYEEIIQLQHLPPTDYFPAYRQGEFG